MTNDKKQTGFTLLELMVAIAIMGILVAIAAPRFSDTLARSAVKDVVREWQENFYFAQAEAMRLQNNVQLCPSNDGATCNGTTFADGWIVAEGNPLNVLRDTPPPSINGLEISNTRSGSIYTFNGAGRLIGFTGDTLTFSAKKEGSTKPIYERTLTLNTEGRIR